MTHEEELRRRFRLDPPTPQEIDDAALDPEIAKAAQRLEMLSRRFKLGLIWSDCVALAKEEGHHERDAE